MARPRKKYPEFVSICITDLSIVFANMTDEQVGKWCRKALYDMSTDCVSEDVDPMVKECFEEAKRRMISKQDENRKAYENRKSGSNPARKSTSVSTDVLDAVKRDDQLIYGRFENVYLSKDEYNDLARQMGNINDLNQVIENFSAALSDGTRHSRNHFATISYWINYRQQKDNRSQGSSSPKWEQNIMLAREKAYKQIDEMVAKGIIR